MAQNIPDLLTVSLHTQHTHMHSNTRKREREERDSPAVYQDGMVASPPLYLPNLLNDISHSLDVGTAAIWGPVGDLELTHLVSLVSL